MADWSASGPHAIGMSAFLQRHRLSDQDYTVGQLRYDLAKLPAHSLDERLRTSRRVG